MNEIMMTAFHDELEKISGAPDAIAKFRRLARRGSRTAVRAVKGTTASVGDVTRNTYRGFDRRMRDKLNIPRDSSMASDSYMRGVDEGVLKILNKERTGRGRDDFLAATAIQRKFHEPLSRGEIAFDSSMLTPTARRLGSELDMNAVLRGIDNKFYFL